MDHKLNTELKNEHGNPIYPKLVTDKAGNRVRVLNPEHEAEVTGFSTVEKVAEKKKEQKEIKEEKKETQFNQTPWK